jgi:hypothetical protein
MRVATLSRTEQFLGMPKVSVMLAAQELRLEDFQRTSLVGLRDIQLAVANSRQE